MPVKEHRRARVAQKMKLAHIATGDLFRQATRKNTEQAQKAKPYIESGKLVPDEITIQMVLERMPPMIAGMALYSTDFLGI